MGHQWPNGSERDNHGFDSRWVPIEKNLIEKISLLMKAMYIVFLWDDL